MAKIKRRSQATSSNFSTCGGERWCRQQNECGMWGQNPLLLRSHLINVVCPGNVGNPQSSPPGSSGCQHGVLPQ